jgi:two-component system chemotaxis response regulator CheB
VRNQLDERPAAENNSSSSGHDLIVIGASAGGVEALRDLVAGLAPDLPAAVLVVVHTPASGASRLAELLDHGGPLPATRAQDGETIAPGRIYVAPPDRHLVMTEDRRTRLSHGPRENHARPAIDPLFRSAARVFGPRVVGVILSGALSDGSRGLAAIKAAGGVAIVQEPKEARVGDMPRAALMAAAPVDFILPARRIATQIVQIVHNVQLARGAPSDTPRESQKTRKVPEEPGETEFMPSSNTIDSTTDSAIDVQDRQVESMPPIIEADLQAQAQSAPRSGHSSLYACPECGGVLWQLRENDVTHFQCHTGHTYSPQNLLALKSQVLEATLWAAVRLLVEKKTITRQLAAEFLIEGDGAARARVQEMERLDQQNEQTLRQMLQAWSNPSGQAFLIEEALEQGIEQGQQQRPPQELAQG